MSSLGSKLTALHAAYGQGALLPREFGKKDSGGGSSSLADDKRELKDVLNLLGKRDAEIAAFAEKAEAEIKDIGKMSADTKSALEILTKSGADLQDRLMQVEQKLAGRRGAAQGAEDVKGLGAQFTDSDSFKELASKQRGVARISVKAVTSVTSATTGTGGVGDAIQAVRLPGIIAPPERAMTIRDLILPGRTSSPSVEFVQETGYQNMAAMVAEGAAKPQSDLAFDLKTTSVRTLAHWIKASKQVLADIPLLQSYIDGRMRYGLRYVEEGEILAGDGTGQHLLGLIPQATAFDTDLSVSGDQQVDTLRRAILQVRIAEYRASGIVLNPKDWADIELLKDDNGSYLWSNPQVNNGQNLWGLPVVDTNAMPEGEFMVGAFNMAAQVFDREEAAVEVSTEDGDNFTKNMVTIRAEERIALAVFRPESFVHGDF